MGRAAGNARPSARAIRRPARRSGRRSPRAARARHRLRHGQHDARRRAAARAQKVRAVGIDISEPMIAAREARADSKARRRVHLRRRADARVRARELRHDHLALRDVMFFDDSVRAFANLRRAATSGAELKAIVWRSPAENPFMTAAERAAAPFFPEHACSPAGRSGAICIRGSEPRLLDPREEWLDRDRHPAARRRLHATGAASSRLTSRGSDRSAECCNRSMGRRGRGSSKRSAPRSILTCTAQRFASRPRAG